MVIEDSVFLANEAGDKGGAIFTSVPLTVTNSTFLANTAGAGGAAIATIGSYPAYDVSYCSFRDNYGASVLFMDSGNSFSVRNSVIYGGVAPLGIGGGSPSVTVEHTCADADLTAYSPTNIHLDDSSYALSNPFVTVGHRLLLNHNATGQVIDSACVDAADPTLADVELPDWDTLSTRTDDVPDAGDPDAGRHYAPDTSACIGNDNAGDDDGDGICNDLDPP